MPTGGSSGPTGHLTPTGGSMDDYVRRGLEEAQLVLDTATMTKPAVSAYTRRVIAPAARAAYEALSPLANDIASRGGHEGRRLWESVDDLRSLPSTVGEQLARSMSGEDTKVTADKATAKTLENLAGMKQRLQQLSWKNPQQLGVALGKLAELEAALQWEEIASKVIP